MANIINISVGEMAVGQDNVTITTNGIGSCVAVCIYDSRKKIGGMIHSMLPTRNKNSRLRKELMVYDNNTAVAKYVDEAIDRMIEEMEYEGSKRGDMIAKIVGGARMFKFLEDEKDGIGPQNVEMAKAKLKEYNIPIDGENTGGTSGRLAEFNVGNGVVDIGIKI